jgi:hypothetical protein
MLLIPSKHSVYRRRRLDELAVDLGAAERSEIHAERYERNREGFYVARRLKEARRVGSAVASVEAEPPHGQSSGYDDDEIERLAEEEFRRWYEEQLLLDQLGLPNELEP